MKTSFVKSLHNVSTWRTIPVEKKDHLSAGFAGENNPFCTLPNNYSNMKIITMEAG